MYLDSKLRKKFLALLSSCMTENLSLIESLLRHSFSQMSFDKVSERSCRLQVD